MMSSQPRSTPTLPRSARPEPSPADWWPRAPTPRWGFMLQRRSLQVLL